MTSKTLSGLVVASTFVLSSVVFSKPLPDVSKPNEIRGKDKQAINFNGNQLSIVGKGLRMNDLYRKFEKSKSEEKIALKNGSNSGLVAYCVELISSKEAIIMGGYIPNHSSYNSRQTWIWDVSKDTLRPGPTLCKARKFAASLRLNDSSIIISGGSNDNEVLSSNEILNPVGKFQILENLRIPRERHTLAEIRPNQLIIVGGRNKLGYAQEVEFLDLSNKNNTKILGSLKLGRVDAGVAKKTANEIVVFGGENFEDSEEPRMEEFKFATR